MIPQLNMGENPNETETAPSANTLNSKISNFNKTTFTMSNTKQNKKCHYIKHVYYKNRDLSELKCTDLFGL
jgi:hypothetical protein